MGDTAILPPLCATPPLGAGRFYEVVNGQVVEPPEMGVLETWIATLMTEQIAFYFASHGRAGRQASETLFLLDPATGLQRRPDLAFISYDRWPRDRPVPEAAAWGVVPDLAIEFVSPHDLAVDLIEKVEDYFRAGVRQVWVVYPRHALALLHVSATRAELIRSDGAIDGGEILPGFRLRLGDLLAGGQGASPATA
jgi:Uma2 family endonuclease